MADKSSVSNRNVIFGVAILISFALLIMSISLYFNFRHEEMQKDRLSPEDIDSMAKEELKAFIEERRESETVFHSYYLLPFMSFVGILVGSVVYYIMSDKIMMKDYALRKNTRIILKFLGPAERKVVNTLLDNEGKLQQYELSHLPNMNKVRTHRILQSLEEKGIIHKEKLGKINKIVLDKELYEVLKED